MFTLAKPLRRLGLFAPIVDFFIDVLVSFGVKTKLYTVDQRWVERYGAKGALVRDMGIDLLRSIPMFLAIAVIGFAWRPLVLPAAQSIGNLLNPAPPAVVNPPVVIVVPSNTPSATPSPTETRTITPTPTVTLTATLAVTSTPTPVPAMPWNLAVIYIQENCMWMSWEEVKAFIPPGSGYLNTVQGKSILAVYPGVDLGAFHIDDERWGCVFSPSLDEGFVFVNDKGEVVLVPLLK